LTIVHCVSTDRSADLEARLEEMTAAYEAVIAENKTLRALNNDLAAQLETLKRRFFGRSSEKQSIRQTNRPGMG
jgi:uncharacterized protein YukE